MHYSGNDSTEVNGVWLTVGASSHPIYYSIISTYVGAFQVVAQNGMNVQSMEGDAAEN